MGMDMKQGCAATLCGLAKGLLYLDLAVQPAGLHYLNDQMRPGKNPVIAADKVISAIGLCHSGQSGGGGFAGQTWRRSAGCRGQLVWVNRNVTQVFPRSFPGRAIWLIQRAPLGLAVVFRWSYCQAEWLIYETGREGRHEISCVLPNMSNQGTASEGLCSAGRATGQGLSWADVKKAGDKPRPKVGSFAQGIKGARTEEFLDNEPLGE